MCIRDSPGRLDPTFRVCDVALRVAVLHRPADLVESQSHETQIRLARRDLLRGSEPDTTGNPHAHHCRAIEHDLARHGAVARTKEFLGADVMQLSLIHISA